MVALCRLVTTVLDGMVELPVRTSTRDLERKIASGESIETSFHVFHFGQNTSFQPAKQPTSVSLCLASFGSTANSVLAKFFTSVGEIVENMDAWQIKGCAIKNSYIPGP